MIRLGLRLTLGGGREAALRALVTAAAVALGVGLLLMALAGVNGLHSQTQRGAWLDTSPTTPHDDEHLGVGSVVVAAQRRPVRRPGHRPGRCRRHGADLACPAGTRASAGTRAVLRLAGARTPVGVDPGRPAGRPVSRTPDRNHRPSRPPVSQLADHRHRPRLAPTLAGPGGGRSPRHPADAGQLRCLQERRRQRVRPAVDPGHWSGRLVAARAHLDLHRQSAVRRQARGALRRHAARGCHAAADLGDFGRGGDGGGLRRSVARLRPVLSPPTAALPRPLHGRAVGRQETSRFGRSTSRSS